jgi:hypothetical protein
VALAAVVVWTVVAAVVAITVVSNSSGVVTACVVSCALVVVSATVVAVCVVACDCSIRTQAFLLSLLNPSLQLLHLTSIELIQVLLGIPLKHVQVTNGAIVAGLRVTTVPVLDPLVDPPLDVFIGLRTQSLPDLVKPVLQLAQLVPLVVQAVPVAAVPKVHVQTA